MLCQTVSSNINIYKMRSKERFRFQTYPFYHMTPSNVGACQIKKRNNKQAMNSDNTQNNQPTKKQLDFIADIQEFTGIQFTGSTKKEASKYISDNIELYQLNIADTWILSNGYF